MVEKSQDIVFNDFYINPSERALYKSGVRVHLAKKPFAVLSYLIQHRGELVTRDQLLAKFWPGNGVYDEAVYRCISSIRHALADTDEHPQYLETRWREGYCFIADVHYRASVQTQPGAANWRRIVLVSGSLVAAIIVGFSLWPAKPFPDDATQISSIAVLAMKGPESDAWLLQGLTDELVHVTSNIEGVRVVSAIAVKDTDQDPVVLGDRLGANALLQSRLLVQPNDSELQVQLISCLDGTVLWTYREAYDNNRSSSASVIKSLASRLSAKLREPPRVGPKQKSTWLKYLRARHQWKLRTPASILSAIRLYEEVLAAEPDFADAYAGLAEANIVAPLYAGARPDISYPNAKAAAEEALRLDPNNARAHVSLAVYYSQYEFDWRKSEIEFSRSIELDPNSAQAHQWMADALCFRLLIEECRYHYGIAFSLDPLSPVLDLSLGLADRFGGDFATAEMKFRSTLERYPDFGLARFQLGLVLDAQGRFQEAIEQWERIYPRYGPALLGSSLANAFAEIGNPDQADLLHRDLTRLREEEYVSAVMMAGMSLTRGSVEEALDWLEISRDERDDLFSSIAVIHHFFVLHNEPRFIAMVESLGIPADRLHNYRSAHPPQD